MDITGFDRVLIQSFTCAAVPLPIIAAGKKITYIDIEPSTYSMDFEDLKKKHTQDAKVLILQHTYGITPAHREKILKFADENHIFVIEDLAHGWNCEGLNVKTALVSFGRSKSVSSIFGGAIITSDDNVKHSLSKHYKNLKQPANGFIYRSLLYKPMAMLIKSSYDIGIGKILHLIVKKLNLLIPEITDDEKSGKFNNIFAAAYPRVLAELLIEQLDKLPRMNSARKAAVSAYSNGKSFDSLSRYPLRIHNRNEIIHKLAEKSVYLGNWYNRPVGGVKFDLEKLGYVKGSCPVSELISEEIVNLPTLLTENDTRSIIHLTDKLRKI